MDHTFHAFFQLDESAIFGHADHASAHDGADGIAVDNGFPGILGALFEAQADPFADGIEVEHNDINLVAHCHHLGRMLDAPPAHVCDMQESVDTTHVNKGTEISNIFNFTRNDAIDFNAFEKVLFFNFTLFFKQSSAADNNIATTTSQLDDFDFHLFADVAVQVACGTEGQLAGGHEGIHTDIHFETTLDPACDGTFYNTVVVVYFLYMFPVFDAISFDLGKVGGTMIIFGRFNIKIKLRSENRLVFITKFFKIDHAFAFIADIHRDAVISQADDTASNHFALFEILRGFVHQLGHAFLGELFNQFGLQFVADQISSAPGQFGHQIFHETTRLLKLWGWKFPRYTG